MFIICIDQIISIKSKETSLSNLLARIHEEYDVNIYAKINHNIIIPAIVINEKPLECAIKMICDLAGLEYYISNEIIYIVEQPVKTIIYNLRIKNIESIREYISTIKGVKSCIYDSNSNLIICANDKGHEICTEYISNIESSHNKEVKVHIKVMSVTTSDSNISALDQIIERLICGAALDHKHNYRNNRDNRHNQNSGLSHNISFESIENRILHGVKEVLKEHKYSGNIKTDSESSTVIVIKNHETGHILTNGNAKDGFSLEITPQVYENGTVTIVIKNEMMHEEGINVSTCINVNPGEEYLIGSHRVNWSTIKKQYFINMPILRYIFGFLNRNAEIKNVKQYFVILKIEL